MTKIIEISEQEFWETRGRAQDEAIKQLKEEGYENICIVKDDFENVYIVRGTM